MRARMRLYWLRLHRWIGLACAGVLLVAGLTGAVLVVAKRGEDGGTALQSSSGGFAPLQPSLTALRSEFGPAAAFTFRLPLREGESLQVAVGAPWRQTIHLDAASGRELARHAADAGFVQGLFELHSSLFAGEGGRPVLALAALAYLGMMLSGLVLWWPARWRAAFRIRRGWGALAVLADLHRVAGATLGLLVLVSAATGAYLAWRPLAASVTFLSGGAALQPPPSPRPQGRPEPDLDAVLRRARAYWPAGRVSTLHVPPEAAAVVRVRVRLADDPHPIGMSTIWLDPAGARLLEARPWTQLDAGTRAFSFVYPLHTGSLGGRAGSVLTFAAGVALAGYCVSGVWLWWRRSAARRAAGRGLGPSR